MCTAEDVCSFALVLSARSKETNHFWLSSWGVLQSKARHWMSLETKKSCPCGRTTDCTFLVSIALSAGARVLVDRRLVRACSKLTLRELHRELVGLSDGGLLSGAEELQLDEAVVEATQESLTGVGVCIHSSVFSGAELHRLK